MKKLMILVVSLLIMINLSSTYAGTIRTVSGGDGTGTYDYVHTEDYFWKDDIIICKFPGDEICPKSLGLAGNNEEIMVDYAIAQISASNLTGSYTDLNLGKKVSWTATTINPDVDSEIHVVDVE